MAYHALAGSGNVAIIGAGADDRIVHVAAAQIADAARVHNTGGPLALPVVAVHRAVADYVIRAVLEAVAGRRPAPLPTQSLRDLALGTLDAMRQSGASLLVGGHLPDDALHRMGWTFPTTVLSIGSIANLDLAEPLGPVLRVATWETKGELVASLRQERHRDGIACLWGLGDELASDLSVPRPGEHSTPDEAAEHDEVAAGAPQRGLLPHRAIVRDGGPQAALRNATLPAAAPAR